MDRVAARPLVQLLVVLASALTAWALRFVQDDAFILFRYARSFARGQGLVWNPGERVEGYTSFLWTVVIGGSMRAGADPVVSAQALGVLAFALTVWLTWRLAGRVLGRGAPSALTALFVAANASMLAWATGGLETSLHALLVVASVASVARALEGHTMGPAGIAGVALVWVLLLLNRLDGALVLIVLSAALGVVWHQALARPASWRPLTAAAPALAVLAAWIVWKTRFYGDVLPNTFYAKSGGGDAWWFGLRYLGTFFVSFWLVPILVVGIGAARALVWDAPPVVRVAAACVAAWSAYVMSIGGDFMEFRFMVPVLPLFFIVAGWLTFTWVVQPRVRTALVFIVFAGSLHHALLFGRTTPRFSMETIRELEGHLAHPDANWAGVGRALGAAFTPGAGVSIAVMAAGAVPYFSDLPALDMFGLTDAWVPRHGQVMSDKPGHQRLATLDYLRERRVTLAVGHPWVRLAAHSGVGYAGANLRRFGIMPADWARLPAGARVIEIPLDAGRFVAVLQLEASAAVDAAIAARGWKTSPID